MIVRDEERMLPGCLASVRGAVDEIVVVDTGSRDGTRAIAQAAGARIYEFPWCDDFAAARNEALRHTRAPWVLVLDADERLAPGSSRALRAAVSRARFDCGMLRLHDATRVDAAAADVLSGRERQAEIQLVPRLLRRTDGLAYVDVIHENVMPWLRRRGNRVGGVNVDIVHLGGSLEVVVAKDKLRRNIDLLRERIARSPGDLSAYGYLAHDCLRAQEPDEAYRIAERGWQELLTTPEITTSIHRLATARAYVLIGRRQYADARETVRRARAVEGDNPDFAFFEAYSFESEAMEPGGELRRGEKLAAAREGYRRCLGFGVTIFAQAFVLGARGCYGMTRLGTVELVLGHPSMAQGHFEAALALCPTDRAALLGKAEAILQGGDPVTALVELEPLLDRAPDAWVLASSAAHALGRRADAKLFADRARALTGGGFIAPHRGERLRLVSAALAPRVA